MSWFNRKRRKTVALIDIAARTVNGACVHYRDKGVPEVVYGRSLPIEIQQHEDHATAMLRALKMLSSSIETDGVAALARITKESSIDDVVVAIDSPWQDTVLRTEHVVKEEDFYYTKSLEDAVVKKVTSEEDWKYSNSTIVGTILNGYEVSNAYGKKARKATVIVLAAQMDKRLEQGIRKAVVGLSASAEAKLISGAVLRYKAVRQAFPHEHNALIVDATGPLAEVSLIRNGLLAAVSETPEAGVVHDLNEQCIRGFADLAKQYPLPHTIFLLARFDQVESIQKKVATINFSTSWLSDNAPNLQPVLLSHMNGLVKQKTTTPVDLPILLMALYCRNS